MKTKARPAPHFPRRKPPNRKPKEVTRAGAVKMKMDATSPAPPGALVEPVREVYEALLSNPLLGAAEAVALLGTCRTARDVKFASSLRAIRAVAVTEESGDDVPVVPKVRSLLPSTSSSISAAASAPGGGSNTTRRKRWRELSAVRIAPARHKKQQEGATTTTPPATAAVVARFYVRRSTTQKNHEEDSRGGDGRRGAARQEEDADSLRALVRLCPNIVSMRVKRTTGDLAFMSDLGRLLTAELGTLAPKLEVLELPTSCVTFDTFNLRAALAALPRLRGRVLDHYTIFSTSRTCSYHLCIFCVKSILGVSHHTTAL